MTATAYMSARSGLLREVKTYVKVAVRPRRFPHTRFVIFGAGRCGSSLLVDLLNSHPSIHCEGEILHDPILMRALYLRCRALVSPGEVYGFKLLTYQLQSVQKIRDPKGFLEGLHSRGYRFIHLSRRNVLRHAVSNLYARSTGTFHRSSHDGQAHIQLVPVDLDQLLTWMTWLKETSQLEKRLLERIAHLPLNYEDDLLESGCHQRTVDTIADYLGIPHVEVATDYARVTPRELSEFVDNYEELVRFVEKTEFREYLSS